MNKHKLIIPTLVLLPLMACSNLFNNDDNNGPKLDLQTSQAPSKTTTFNDDTLVFQPIQNGDEPAKYPPFKSQMSNQQVIINGYFLAASGFLPVGDFEQEGKTITIRIHRAEFDNGAPDEPRGFFYDAYVSDLSEGTYTVKIIHEDDLMRSQQDEIGESHTIFEKKFEVQ